MGFGVFLGLGGLILGTLGNAVFPSGCRLEDLGFKLEGMTYVM